MDVFLGHSHVVCFFQKRQGNAKLRMIVYAPHGIQVKFWEQVSLFKMDLELSRCHLRPYFLLFFISFINLFVYLFPIDVNYENLLLMFVMDNSQFITVKVGVRGTLLLQFSSSDL